MFKKNNGNDESKALAVARSPKTKKAKKTATVYDIIRTKVVEFKDFRTYCINNTKSGDWVFNLGAEPAVTKTFDPSVEHVDSKEFMETYDENLVQVYRHQDSSLVMKNVKMLGDQDPEKKGLYSGIANISLYASSKLESKIIKSKTLETICSKACNAYDSFMMENEDGEIYGIHVWVPVWRTTSDTGVLVSLLDGRVNLIIT